MENLRLRLRFCFLRRMPSLILLLACMPLLFSPQQHAGRAVGDDVLAFPDRTNTAPTPQPFAANPQAVEGHDKCVDCHKSEYRAWSTTHHATQTFDMLRSGDSARDSRDIAKKLNISAREIARSAICVHCHATPQTDHLGNQRVIPGVSCEGCHGASGGEDGWLNLHAVYGPSGTRRETESAEHYQLRTVRCTDSGQIRSANAFRLARACFQCHIVWDEQLVNVGEHPSGGDFEFVTWSMGEVRHNFHLDQDTNALAATLWSGPLHRPDGETGTGLERVRLMYVAGRLGQLSVALRNRSYATEDGNFAGDMETFIEDAVGELEDIITDYSDDDDDDDLEYDPDDLPALQTVVKAVNTTLEASSEIDMGETQGPTRSAVLFKQAAEEVDAAADQFIARHDGSDLSVIDDYAPDLADLEEQNQDVVKGRAWEPQ